MAKTKDAAERVRHYRESYANRPWTIHDGAEAYTAATGACIGNALDALESGDPHEASVWTDLGQLLSFRYRKAF